MIAERYRIDELLGAGAMGAVYRAEHILMRKPVALKVLHSASSQNEEIVARFEREAIAAGRIGHPLVLEYIKGKSLGSLISETAPCSLEKACLIGFQIASALNAAHELGIVHRDLKPENVMIPDAPSVSANDATLLAAPLQLSVKVLDFGLAKMSLGKESEATQLTQAGAVYGTPQYMSPEQTEGKQVDHRADLYALGLIIFEMLEGQPPFLSAEVMPLLVMQMTKAAPPLNSQYPEAIRLLVAQLLEKDPQSRPQNAAEIMSRLAPYLPETPGALAYTGAVHSSIPADKKAPTPLRMRKSAAPDSLLQVLFSQAQQRFTDLWRKRQQLAAFLRAPVRFGSRKIARAVPLALLSVLALISFWLLTQAEPTNNEALKASNVSERIQTIDPALLKVIEAAEQGSESALYALEQRTGEARSSKEWLALAQARLMRQKVSSALEAYQAYLNSGARLKDEAMVLGALRRLADNKNFAPAILEFIAEQEQPDAPDFLFDVWSRTAQKTTSTTLAFETLKESPMVNNYSDPLRLALALREAEECSEISELLPEVIEKADQRAANRLKALSKKTGCGKNETEDCFTCLRSTLLLKQALRQAEERKAPRFPLLRRWSWR